jgi:hypothetical protein
MTREITTDQIAPQSELAQADLDTIVGGAPSVGEIVVTKRTDVSSTGLFLNSIASGPDGK